MSTHGNCHFGNCAKIAVNCGEHPVFAPKQREGLLERCTEAGQPVPASDKRRGRAVNPGPIELRSLSQISDRVHECR